MLAYLLATTALVQGTAEDGYLPSVPIHEVLPNKRQVVDQSRPPIFSPRVDIA